MIAPNVQMRSGSVCVLIGALKARLPVDIRRIYGMDAGIERATFLAWVHVPSTTMMLNPGRKRPPMRTKVTKNRQKKKTNLKYLDLEKMAKQQMSLQTQNDQSFQINSS